MDGWDISASAAGNLQRRSITNVEHERDGVHFFLFPFAKAQDGLILAGFREEVLCLVEAGIAARTPHPERPEFLTVALDGDLGVF